jgi:peptidoglycan/xylan/chitin deacetylase (PgdA/CDA1 family)
MLAIMALLIPTLAACGIGDDDDGDPRTGMIEWRVGTPPGDLASADQTTDEAAPTEAVMVEVIEEPTEEAQPEEAPTQAVEPTPEPEPTLTEAVVAEAPQEPVTGTRLTPEELEQYQPNEVGYVPVLMYHNILPALEPSQENDVLWRTIDDLKADLQWLYDNNFYVVTMEEYIKNNISAPAGKHPVVLTFDDSRPSQFYYNIADDGSVSIDPNSAIAILEEFFDAHPDFGRTAVFGVLPIWCFDFEEPSQTPYCQDKLQWLVDNGYEVANHTWDHQNLSDVSNEVFQQKIADTTLWIQEQVGAETASNVLILPFGVFPSGVNAEQQWRWFRNGFDYNGQPINLISVVAAGANPAPSPNSTDFDPMSIARIGSKDYPSEGEADLFFNFWFGVFEDRPDLLYISDGNPDTVTAPEVLPDAQVGTFDEEKAIADGKEIIRY